MTLGCDWALKMWERELDFSLEFQRANELERILLERKMGPQWGKMWWVTA